jgi:hypothetical protein
MQVPRGAQRAVAVADPQHRETTMNKRVMCATLLAIGTVGVVGGSSASAVAPCKGGDTLTAVTEWTASYDTNANGYVCASVKSYHAPKKPGPPTTSTTYYDDRI